MAHILPEQPVASLAAYRARGGGEALAACEQLGPQGVLDVVRNAGLRGRGGAGFPTGIKWDGLASSDAVTRFVVCNAAEGEPGTFKDRAILRRDPYQVVEGLAVAAYATGATQGYIGIKEKYTREAERLQGAAAELAHAGLLGDLTLTIVPGPDDYLFGEEKALLEVIEGRDPLPRLFPPYAQGLFEEPNGPAQPTVVNNVETLANVPHIVTHGADWYRSFGTERSPGTIVATIGGDVTVEAVAEVEMGTPLRMLVDDIGGGTASGRAVKLVLNGVSNAPMTSAELDTPLSIEGMRAAGSGLGSAGFTVFDDTACAVAVAGAASEFLSRASCGQCPPCKLGTAAIKDRLAAVAAGRGSAATVGEVAAWSISVTDANRCGLGAGQQALARGVLDRFPEDFAHHIGGEGCGREALVTTIADWGRGGGPLQLRRPAAHGVGTRAQTPPRVGWEWRAILRR